MKKAVTIVTVGLTGLLAFSGVGFAAEAQGHMKQEQGMGDFDPKGGNKPEPKPYHPYGKRSFRGRDLVAMEPDSTTTSYAWATLVKDETDDRVVSAALFADDFDYELSDGEYKAVKKALQTKDDIDLECHEVLPIVFDNYTGGELDVEFEFATDYSLIETDGTVAVYISIDSDEEGVINYIVKGYVTKEGTIRFHINEDCATAIAKYPAYIAIFSAA